MRNFGLVFLFSLFLFLLRVESEVKMRERASSTGKSFFYEESAPQKIGRDKWDCCNQFRVPKAQVFFCFLVQFSLARRRLKIIIKEGEGRGKRRRPKAPLSPLKKLMGIEKE